MYSIEKRPSGFLLTFSGMISESEMEKWVSESRVALTSVFSGFGVLVDMRGLGVLNEKTKDIMKNGQELFKTAGMKRSAVIVDKQITALQFQRIAKETGIYKWERYVAATEEDCNQKAIAWVKDGVDPDLSKNNILN